MLISARAVLEPKKSGSPTILDSQGTLSDEKYFRDMVADTKELREAVLLFKNWGFNVNYVTKWGFEFNGSAEYYSDANKLGTPLIDITSGDPIFTGSDINFKYNWPVHKGSIRIQLNPFVDSYPQNDKYFFPNPTPLDEPLYSQDKDYITNERLIGQKDLSEIETYLHPTSGKNAPSNAWPYPNGTHLWQLPYLLGSKAPNKASKKKENSHYWKYENMSEKRKSPYESGEKCLVAIVDTGIDITHPYFKLLANKVSEENIDEALNKQTLQEYRDYYKQKLIEAFSNIADHLKPLIDIVKLSDAYFKEKKREFINLNLHMIINGKTGIEDTVTTNELLKLANSFDVSIFQDVRTSTTRAFDLIKPLKEILEEMFDLMLMRRELEMMFDSFANAKDPKGLPTKKLISTFQAFRSKAIDEIFEIVPEESVPHGSAVVSNLLAIAPKVTWKMFSIEQESKLGNTSGQPDSIVQASLNRGIRHAIQWIGQESKNSNLTTTGIINLSYSISFSSLKEFHDLIVSCNIFNILIVVSSGNMRFKSEKKNPFHGVSAVTGLNNSGELDGSWNNCIQVGGAYYIHGITADENVLDEATVKKSAITSDSAVAILGTGIIEGETYSDLLSPTICAINGEPQIDSQVLSTDLTDGQIKNVTNPCQIGQSAIWCPWWTKMKPLNNSRVQHHHEASFKPVSGTSFSAPQISGVAAILASKFPSFTPKIIVQTLYYSAISLDKGQSVNGLEASNNPNVFRMVHVDRALQLGRLFHTKYGNTRKKTVTYPTAADWINLVSQIK